MEVMTFVCKNAPFPAFEQTCWRSIEVVITSTTGNRVAVMSGTRVRIPPSPPRRDGLRDHNPVRINRTGFLIAPSSLLTPQKSSAALSRKKHSLVPRSVFCSTLAYHFFAVACLIAQLKDKNSSFLANRSKKKSAMQCMVLFLFSRAKFDSPLIKNIRSSTALAAPCFYYCRFHFFEKAAMQCMAAFCCRYAVICERSTPFLSYGRN